jgi:DHA3 family macrolide efflux protein-like MFS transporter
MLAIPWYFAKNFRSDYFNASYGILTLVVLLFGLYAGTLVDRFSRKKNFIANSLVCGTLLGAIAVYGYTQNGLPDLLIVAAFGLTMLNYNIHFPTLYAFGQEISHPDDYEKVNMNIEIVGQSSSIFSGAFAAILLEGVHEGTGRLFGFEMNFPFEIRAWNIWEIFMMDAVTYFIAVVLIWFIRYTSNPLLDKQSNSVVQRVRIGFSYLKQHPEFMIFGLFSYSVFAMLLVEIHAVLPGYIERHLREDGSVFAAADLIYAVGALGAGIFVNRVFQATHIVKAVIILTLITAAIFFWAFASKSVLVIYTVSVILGFCNAGIRVLRLTYFFRHIPNELMGRVNSIFSMANVLTRSLFIFLFSTSFFTFDDHVVWAYFIMATFLIISGTVLIVNYRKLNT